MQLNYSVVETSPLDRNRRRLVGEISFDNPKHARRLYWLEVDEEYGEYLTNTGNPWLAWLLPLAVALGEPLRLCQPVDRTLFDNVHRLMRIWKRWYPDVHIVPIEADVVDRLPPEEPRKTAAFFSGGVDSLFTILSHQANLYPGQSTHIDEQIFIHGFDVALDAQAAFQRVHDLLQRAAERFGTRLLVVTSNVRQSQFMKMVDWTYLGHGGALACIALALEKRYKAVIIPSGSPPYVLAANGTHPDTDPLFSTSSTQIIHDTAVASRPQKTEFIAQSEIALQTVRVCSRDNSATNCGVCRKCLTCMLTLELCNALRRCTTFKPETFGVNEVKAMMQARIIAGVRLRELEGLARQKERPEIAEAIKQGLRRDWLFLIWDKFNLWLSQRLVARWPGILRPLSRESARAWLKMRRARRPPPRHQLIRTLPFKHDPLLSGSNWYPYENIGEHGPGWWTGPGTRSTLDFPFEAGGEATIKFRVLMALAPDVLESLQLCVNDHAIALTHITETPGTKLFQGNVPRTILASDKGFIRIIFEVNRTIRPNTIDPQNPDQRHLGLLCNWIEIYSASQPAPE